MGSDDRELEIKYEHLQTILAEMESAIIALSGGVDSALLAKVAHETLGEQVFDFFLRNKRQEWRDYRAQVTPFELQRYLPAL